MNENEIKAFIYKEFLKFLYFKKINPYTFFFYYKKKYRFMKNAQNVTSWEEMCFPIQKFVKCQNMCTFNDIFNYSLPWSMTKEGWQYWKGIDSEWRNNMRLLNNKIWQQ